MRAFALLVISMLLLACAAPAPEADQAAPAIASASSPQAVPHKRPPPMSDPLPPERVPDSKPVALDRSCTADADCTVKNVGNCCGYYPACVNKNSPTDPQGVQAECAKNGMAAVCGFSEITACRCVRNQCVDEKQPVGGWSDDPPPPPPTDR